MTADGDADEKGYTKEVDMTGKLPFLFMIVFLVPTMVMLMLAIRSQARVFMLLGTVKSPWW
jgi:hypothetical protein